MTRGRLSARSSKRWDNYDLCTFSGIEGIRHSGTGTDDLSVIQGHARLCHSHAHIPFRGKKNHTLAAEEADRGDNTRPRPRGPDAEEGYAYDGRSHHSARHCRAGASVQRSDHHLHPAPASHHPMVRGNGLCGRLYQGIQTQQGRNEREDEAHSPDSPGFRGRPHRLLQRPDSGEGEG